jgi:hypothetical protein
MTWTDVRCVLCMGELYRDYPVGRCRQLCRRKRLHNEYLASIKPRYEKAPFMSVGRGEDTGESNMLGIKKGLLGG